jgi:hypothetical protein
MSRPSKYSILGVPSSRSTCSVVQAMSPRSATIHQSALLVGALPANPLQWQVITSEIDKQNSTTTLYGNDVAVRYPGTSTQLKYPAGSVLSLVTWTQREDSRWFGARIPDGVKSVGFVFGAIADARPSYSYQECEGPPLKKLSSEEGPTPSGRAAYLLSQRAAVMP